MCEERTTIYPVVNKKGQHICITTVDIVVGSSFILNWVKEGKLRKVKEHRNGLGTLYLVSYSGTGGTLEKYYFNAEIGYKGSMGFTSKTKFTKVPLLEKRFVKVIKTWKDKRKGYEDRSYATYQTELRANPTYFSALKNSGGKIYVMTNKRTWKTEYLSIKDYVSLERGRAENIHQITFRRDSQGNWK